MKIKEEQLKTIQNQQQKVGNILSQIGVLETQKHSFLQKTQFKNYVFFKNIVKTQ